MNASQASSSLSGISPDTTRTNLHVGILLGSFSAGGSERAMINFANGLVARGATVDLIAGRPEGPFRDLVDSRVAVHDLNCGMMKGLSWIRRYLRDSKPDILFSSQLHVNVVGLLSKLLNRTKTKLVLREATTPSEYAKVANGMRMRLSFWISKRLASVADHHVAVGEHCREDYIDFYGLNPEKVTTVYSSFVNDEIFEKSKLPVSHKWFDGQTRVIASMGRVMPVKDFPTLIRAFAKVRDRDDVKLIIIGETERDPACFSEVKSLVTSLDLDDEVDFVGFQANPFPYLAHSEVYVLSSRFEGMPGALIQAIALGCKPVSTDCRSGPREILRNGERGRLVPVGDHDQLAEAIRGSLQLDHDRSLGIEWTDEFTEHSSLTTLIQLFEGLAHSG